MFGRPGLVLHGGTEVKKRKELVKLFQEDESVPFFILSLKAGGTGLNLTAASHVIHFDRWWNPAIENQATDRAFRIGQTRNVLVHKFVCRGTVEDKIDQMIESKNRLAGDFLEGGAEVRLTEMDDDGIAEDGGAGFGRCGEGGVRPWLTLHGNLMCRSPKRRRKAALHVQKLAKKGQAVAPVIMEGRTIARTFWGKSWCENLERYSDYESRLPRGRTYVRNGSVVDLKIARGEIAAMVSGSEIYKVRIAIVPLRSRVEGDCARTARAASTRSSNCCRGASPRA